MAMMMSRYSGSRKVVALDPPDTGKIEQMRAKAASRQATCEVR